MTKKEYYTHLDILDSLSLGYCYPTILEKKEPVNKIEKLLSDLLADEWEKVYRQYRNTCSLETISDISIKESKEMKENFDFYKALDDMCDSVVEEKRKKIDVKYYTFKEGLRILRDGGRVTLEITPKEPVKSTDGEILDKLWVLLEDYRNHWDIIKKIDGENPKFTYGDVLSIVAKIEEVLDGGKNI